MELHSDGLLCGLFRSDQGGLRAGVTTSYNEFKQLSVFYGHTKAFCRCSGVLSSL